MTSYFIQNLYLGRSLSDEKMADIPHPRTELHIHVMYKTLQVGSTLGLFVFGPLVGLVRGRSFSAVRQGVIQGGRIGTLIGIPAGPILTELTLGMRKADHNSIYDRSYRIRHNRGQILTDRVTTYGTMFGAFASLAMGGTFFTGTAVGISTSFIAASIFAASLGAEKKEGNTEE